MKFHQLEKLEFFFFNLELVLNKQEHHWTCDSSTLTRFRHSISVLFLIWNLTEMYDIKAHYDNIPNMFILYDPNHRNEISILYQISSCAKNWFRISWKT